MVPFSRSPALIVALEDIDTNLEEYKKFGDNLAGRQGQRKRLSELIERHGLKRTNGLEPLDVYEFRHWVRELAQQHTREEYAQSAQDIFKYGSDMLEPSYLKKVGYVKPELKRESFEVRADLLHDKISKGSSAIFERSGVTSTGRAQVKRDPGKPLEEIYKTMFGVGDTGSWMTGTEHILRGCGGSMFLEGVIGAAVYVTVFMRPVPWSFPVDQIRSVRENGFGPLLEEAAEKVGCRDFNYEEIIYKAAQLQVAGRHFQNSIVRTVAESLADHFAITLIPQLEVLGIEKLKEETQTAFRDRISAALTDVFSDALVMRGQMHADVRDWRLVWFTSNGPNDDGHPGERFEARNPPTEKQAGGIAFSVVPGMVIREESPETGDKWAVASKALGYRKTE